MIARGKAAAQQWAAAPAASHKLPTDPVRKLIVTRGSDVKLKPMVWWEPGLILRAAITLVGGREGQGKSTIVAGWAARETLTGGSVLWLGSEESREQAQAPRLTAAGADMTKVIFLDVELDNVIGALRFPLDLAGIEDVIREHNVTMIVLDPCKGYMPAGFSGNDDVAVRQYLEPLASLAARNDVVLLGICHFGKRAGDDSGKLLLGSIAWSQVARSVLSVAVDPDTNHRIVTATKGNYAATERSIECEIITGVIHTDDGPTEIGTVRWIGDTTIDARDILSGGDGDDARDIDAWLRDFLATGSKKANDVYSAADAAGYSKDQAKRAKKRLGIKAERPSGDGPWFWSMPTPPSQGSTDQGSTPVVHTAAPLLPCTSGGVQEGEIRPREQGAGECSLGAPSAVESPLLTPPTPLDARRQELSGRRTIRVKGQEVPRCYICGKAVVGGQGDAHLSCVSKQETA
ncbi:hypothetical protein AU194_21880 [Mycobacterium sp. GA-2829]|nr:hypothetical protein AU194_21880 [Mycobacterium sp. GA-2829]